MNTYLHTSVLASRRSMRTLALGATLFAAVGFGGPSAALADWDTLEPGQTASERSIALIEGKDPANASADANDAATFRPPTANERSIALIESKEAAGGVLADGVPAAVPFESR